MSRIKGTKKIKRGDFQLNDGEEKIMNLIHVVKKSLQCQGMPSLVGFTLALLENIHRNNNLELLQGNVANGLDVEKFMHKAWSDRVKFHRPRNKEKFNKWNQEH